VPVFVLDQKRQGGLLRPTPPKGDTVATAERSCLGIMEEQIAHHLGVREA